MVKVNTSEGNIADLIHKSKIFFTKLLTSFLRCSSCRVICRFSILFQWCYHDGQKYTTVFALLICLLTHRRDTRKWSDDYWTRTSGGG